MCESLPPGYAHISLVCRSLLDTHTFLWFGDNDPRLSRTARQLIEDPHNAVLFSVVSVWESSIQVSIGKAKLDPDPIRFYEEHSERNSFTLLSIELRHLAPISILPAHHGDPFDRLLIAQALVEGIPIISRDPAFDAYDGLVRIW
jgi:PIN domain nuclease of toxin-antitoxin system